MNKNSVSESAQQTEQKTEMIAKSRRTFIKKAVYVAPTLVALGSLIRPTDAKAGFGKPPSGPTWP